MNVGSGSRRFPIFFSENRWQGVNLSQEMNLQLVNIIEEMLTNLVNFCPFVNMSPLCSIICTVGTYGTKHHRGQSQKS